MPCLVWDSPQGRRVYDLNRAMLIVGRDDVADLQIAEKSVSRRHALVQVENGTVRVTDLGSSSGTRINGARLTPDLPSSLEAGDFVQLGRVTMTFHPQPPPARKRAPEKAPARPKARPAAAAARSAAAPPPTGRWKMIALVLAFFVVAALGALIAVIATRDDSSPQPPPAVVEKPVEMEVPTPPAKNEEPSEPAKVEPPPPKEETQPEEPGERKVFAPAGALPPQGFFDPDEYPDLIEFEYTTYYPVRLVTWDGARVEVVGGDGRTYRLPQSKVTKGENRADLARRAEIARLGLDPADAGAHLELARWCAKRFLGSETRALAQRVLTLRPGDEEATRLLRSTE